MSTELNKPQILFVDDQEDIQFLMRVLLMRQGYEVAVAGTVAAGKALATEQHFDLYMLDARLPDGSGLELGQHLQQLMPQTPVLYCTGDSDEAHRQAALDSGGYGYLIKPVAPEKLCLTIEQALQKQKP